MKKSIFILFNILLLNFLYSCKDVTGFLDEPPGIEGNEDLVFSRRDELEKYVSTLYLYGMPSIFPLRSSDMGLGANGLINTNIPGGSWMIMAGATDEAHPAPIDGLIADWHSGNVNASNITRIEDQRYYLRWQAIRVANIILERIEELPAPISTDPEVIRAFQDYKKMVRGEALFMRALNNFETLKRYGGFPIVNKRINTAAETNIPRSTFEESVNAIVKDCDDAKELLPVDQPTNFKGRAQQGAALALKARTLLYAASPLFNTATPISGYGNTTDDKLISYGNYDQNRWKLAADAAKACLDWAGANGYALIDVTANRIPTGLTLGTTASPHPIINGVATPVPNGAKVNGNYRFAWEQNENSEIILATKYWGQKGNFQFPWQHILPRNDYVTNGRGFWNAPSVIFNFVRKYEKRDGTPQTWNMNGGNDLLKKYSELDPRFMQTVVYTSARLHDAATAVPIGEGTNSHKGHAHGGHWMLKLVNDGIGNGNQFPHSPIFRINEMMLSYAEALNEASATPPAVAFENVNRVRARSGMPALPATLTKEQFRQRIHNERDIELAFEDHRMNDARRWLEAQVEGALSGSMLGLEITRDTPTSRFTNYKPYVFMKRVFPTRMYLFPYPLNEVMKGNLKQNPGH